jgi:exodeoxyribonuclease VII small subunit
MPKAKERDLGFEASLTSLEKIVEQLESGDLPLERALELFEEGVALARRCQSQLEEAERKVELLLRERGEIKAVPFELPREGAVNEAEQSAAKTTRLVAAASSKVGASDELEESGGDDSDDSIPF